MSGTSARSRWGFLLAESVLIVLSILLAFAIDAWWDRRQEESRREQLLGALRADFAATDLSLDAAIETAATLVARTGGYLEVVVDGHTVRRDSLLFLLEGIGEFAFYEPTVASYRTALATGELNLIRDAELIDAFTEFDFAFDNYGLHLGLAGQVVYLGALQDLRRLTGGFQGPLRGRGGAPPVRGEDGIFEFRSILPGDYDLRSNEAVAAAEALYWAQVNAWDALVRMDQAASRIVTSVDRMTDKPR